MSGETGRAACDKNSEEEDQVAPSNGTASLHKQERLRFKHECLCLLEENETRGVVPLERSVLFSNVYEALTLRNTSLLAEALTRYVFLLINGFEVGALKDADAAAWDLTFQSSVLTWSHRWVFKEADSAVCDLIIRILREEVQNNYDEFKDVLTKGLMVLIYWILRPTSPPVPERFLSLDAVPALIRLMSILYETKGDQNEARILMEAICQHHAPTCAACQQILEIQPIADRMMDTSLDVATRMEASQMVLDILTMWSFLPDRREIIQPLLQAAS